MSKKNLSLNLEEEIRLRAYQIYEERGRADGHHVEDWLQAEEEIKQRNSRSAAA